MTIFHVLLWLIILIPTVAGWGMVLRHVYDVVRRKRVKMKEEDTSGICPYDDTAVCEHAKDCDEAFCSKQMSDDVE